jgi:uncharacterized protein (DUF488 family)
MTETQIYSIGHSRHRLDDFLALLRQNDVEVVVDVRSAPYSRFVPQYNHDQLRQTLSDAGIRYLYKGRALGGRSEDPDHYVDGRLDYQRLGASDSFVAGLELLCQLARSHRLAIMCSEEDPMACHRGVLIGRKLQDDGQGIRVVHIRGDGSLETQSEMERRLCMQQGMAQDASTKTLYVTADLWTAAETSLAEAVAQAYAAQGERIAPTKTSEDEGR